MEPEGEFGWSKTRRPPGAGGWARMACCSGGRIFARLREGLTYAEIADEEA